MEKNNTHFSRPAGKKKGRRLTHIMAVVFGFIGIFIIVKGFFDMYERIARFTYFDKVIEARSDTLVKDLNGNTFLLYSGSVLKYATRHPQVLVLDGKISFEVANDIIFLTPDTVAVDYGKGTMESGRFPEIYLKEGRLRVEGRILEGPDKHWKDRHLVSP